MASKNVADLERLIEVLVRAIRIEREVRDLYQRTAKRAPTDVTRVMFDLLCLEETHHLERLEEMLRVLRGELQAAKRGKPKAAAADGGNRPKG